MASVTEKRGANVIRLTSDGTASADISGTVMIRGIRFQAGSSSSLTIRDGSASGNIIYFVDGANDLYEEVRINASQGVNVALVNASSDLIVYLYLK